MDIRTQPNLENLSLQPFSLTENRDRQTPIPAPKREHAFASALEEALGSRKTEQEDLHSASPRNAVRSRAKAGQEKLEGPQESDDPTEDVSDNDREEETTTKKKKIVKSTNQAEALFLQPLPAFSPIKNTQAEAPTLPQSQQANLVAASPLTEAKTPPEAEILQSLLTNPQGDQTNPTQAAPMRVSRDESGAFAQGALTTAVAAKLPSLSPEKSVTPTIFTNSAVQTVSSQQPWNALPDFDDVSITTQTEFSSASTSAPVPTNETFAFNDSLTPNKVLADEAFSPSRAQAGSQQTVGSPLSSHVSANPSFANIPAPNGKEMDILSAQQPQVLSGTSTNPSVAPTSLSAPTLQAAMGQKVATDFQNKSPLEASLPNNANENTASIFAHGAASSAPSTPTLAGATAVSGTATVPSPANQSHNAFNQSGQGFGGQPEGNAFAKGEPSLGNSASKNSRSESENPEASQASSTLETRNMSEALSGLPIKENPSSSTVEKSGKNVEALTKGTLRRVEETASRLQAQGGGSAKITINDSKVGHIELRLTVSSEKKVFIEIKSGQDEVKKALEEKTEELRISLGHHKLNLAEIKIVTESSSAQNQTHNGEQGRQDNRAQFEQTMQNFSSQQGSSQQQKSDRNDTSAFASQQQASGMSQKREFRTPAQNVSARTNVQRSANGSLKVSA